VSTKGREKHGPPANLQGFYGGVVSIASDIQFAANFWEMPQGNPSGNGFAAKQNEFPPLASCHDVPQVVSCPGPNELAFTAFNALLSALQNNGSQIDSFVFSRFSGSTRSDFIKYLSGFHPYDGRYSTAYLVGTLVSFLDPLVVRQAGTQQVKDLFAISGVRAATMHRFPVASGLYVFLNPDYFGGNLAGTLFHEGLHGLTNQSDGELQALFGCTISNNTVNLTTYLLQFTVSPPSTDDQIAGCQ
jgi:hypothetical protein